MKLLFYKINRSLHLVFWVLEHIYLNRILIDINFLYCIVVIILIQALDKGQAILWNSWVFRLWIIRLQQNIKTKKSKIHENCQYYNRFHTIGKWISFKLFGIMKEYFVRCWSNIGNEELYLDWNHCCFTNSTYFSHIPN